METLRGKWAAIGAIAFAAFAAFALAMVTIVPADPRTPMFFRLFSVALIIAGVITMFAVVNSTWRRTIFRATTTGVELSFISPLWPAKLMQWPGERILSVIATHQPVAPDQFPAGELTLIIFEGPMVQLFAGHSYEEIAWLAECVGFVTKQIDVVECTDAADDRSPAEDGGRH